MNKYEEPVLELVMLPSDVICASDGLGIVIFDSSGKPTDFIDPYGS